METAALAYEQHVNITQKRRANLKDLQDVAITIQVLCSI